MSRRAPGDEEEQEEEEEDERPIVVDCGSGSCRAGFAGEPAPRVAFPSVVGRPRRRAPAPMPGVDAGDRYVGQEAIGRRFLSLNYPIQYGVVTNWEDMEAVWHHCFYNELRVDPAEHPVLITEPPLNPRACRERAAQLLFDAFKVPALAVAAEPALALRASGGRASGLVLGAGDAASHAVPIYEGYILPHAILRVELGGRDLTEYLAKILEEEEPHGGLFSMAQGREIAGDVKEKLCFVAQDFEAEMKAAADGSAYVKMYELCDGSCIKVGSQRFRCPEVLFQPRLAGKEASGIHEIAFRSILQSDVDTRKGLYANVVLAGGSTMFSGMAERLAKELAALAPPSVEVRVTALPERRYAAWIGGSTLASLSTSQQMWMSRCEYEEHGPALVHAKCF